MELPVRPARTTTPHPRAGRYRRLRSPGSHRRVALTEQDVRVVNRSSTPASARHRHQQKLGPGGLRIAEKEIKWARGWCRSVGFAYQPGGQDRLAPTASCALDAALEGWSPHPDGPAQRVLIGSWPRIHRAGKQRICLAVSSQLCPVYDRVPGSRLTACRAPPAQKAFGFTGTPIQIGACARGSAAPLRPPVHNRRASQSQGGARRRPRGSRGVCPGARTRGDGAMTHFC